MVQLGKKPLKRLPDVGTHVITGLKTGVNEKEVSNCDARCVPEGQVVNANLSLTPAFKPV